MGFDASDLEAVGSARPVAVELAGGLLVYTALVTEVEEDGLVTLGIPAGSWTDADGSWGPEAFGPSVTVDTRAPVIQGEVFETGELRTGTEPGKAEAGEPGDDEPGDEPGDEEESGDEELPETGASTGGAGLWALALLGVGAGLVLVRRRVEA